MAAMGWRTMAPTPRPAAVHSAENSTMPHAAALVDAVDRELVEHHRARPASRTPP